MIILKETPKYVVVHHDMGIGFAISRENKYLCVGGKFHGEKKSASQVEDKGYLGFNKANYNRLAPKKIWVHQMHL